MYVLKGLAWLGIIVALGTAPAAAQTARDSAGVRIVSNPAPGPSTIRVTAAPPLLVIGERDGGPEFSLYRVGDVRALSDGRIAAVNGLELLWFTPDGTFQWRAGGPGEGPAEFKEIAGLWVLPGDSVLVVNRLPAAVRVFAPDGSHARSAPIRFVRAAPMQFAPLSGDVWAGLGFAGEDHPRTPGLFSEDWYALRWELGGEVVDTLDLTRGELYFGDIRRSIRVPGSPRAHLSAGGGRIFSGWGGSYEIRVFDREGRLEQVVRNEVPDPPPLTDTSTLSPAAGRSEVGGRMPDLEVPAMETGPAFHRLVGGDDGRLWVRRSAPDVDEAEWHVYSAAGELAAVAMLPGTLRPTEITATRIIGVTRDEFDVEYIVILANPVR